VLIELMKTFPDIFLLLRVNFHPLCVNPRPLGVYFRALGVNPHPLVVNPHPLGVNPHPLSVNSHPLGVNPSLGNGGNLPGEARSVCVQECDQLDRRRGGDAVGQLDAHAGGAGGVLGLTDAIFQVMQELCAYKNVIISTGGGVVTRRANWMYMQQGLVVYLDYPIPVLAARLMQV
jgi:hypothetical protein